MAEIRLPWWGGASLAAYGLLSALCFAVRWSPTLVSLLDIPFLPVLVGPPALLMYQFDMIIPYLLATVLFVGSVCVGLRSWRSGSHGYIGYLTLAVLIWFAAGFLSYAPGA